MSDTEFIKITISVPVDNSIHEHSARLTYNDTTDVSAHELFNHFIILLENIYGEIATTEALNEIKKHW